MSIESDDLNRILGTLREHYGYDFTGYTQPSMKRRVRRFMDNNAITEIDVLQSSLVNNESIFEHFLQELTINVTEMFRDPLFYIFLRKAILRRLASYPVIKIWVAGCSTGEEVYSLSILLYEEGLLDKSLIYATDINQRALRQAKEAIYTFERWKSYKSNYLLAGGKRNFDDYFIKKYGGALVKKSLRKNITFSVHNLVADKSFNEFQLIMCRNVMIYFRQPLQERVKELFYESLCPFGYLCLGTKESLNTDNHLFYRQDPVHKIYIKAGI